MLFLTCSELGCTDRQGRLVSHGVRYAPDEDPCKTCDCVDGVPQLCTLVQCSPPACKDWRPMPNECCQFECLGGDTGVDIDHNSTLYRYGFG
jgi:hypothetical protein